MLGFVIVCVYLCFVFVSKAWVWSLRLTSLGLLILQPLPPRYLLPTGARVTVLPCLAL